MNAKKLRRKYMREFVGLEKYNRFIAWTVLGNYLLQIVISVTAGSILVTLPATTLTVTLAALLILMISTRLRGLGNIIHEC